MLVAANETHGLVERILAAFLPAAHDSDIGGEKDCLHESGKGADASAKDDQGERVPEVGGGQRLGGDEVEELEHHAADEPADQAANGAVAELAERAGGNAFTGANGDAQEAPAQAAGEH